MEIIGKRICKDRRTWRLYKKAMVSFDPKGKGEKKEVRIYWDGCEKDGIGIEDGLVISALYATYGNSPKGITREQARKLVQEARAEVCHAEAVR